ncbi:hypothetical protein LLG46_13345 [bacterium]|nr:hypothetical protein [bacterium]
MAKFGLCVLCFILSVSSTIPVWAEGEQDGVAASNTADNPSIDLAKPSEPGKPYTSLIIDACGLNLKRCMSPKIKQTDGKEVWGTVKVDIDFIEEHGLVAYAKSMEDAKKNDRCGSNPMIVKALRIDGRAYSDPVIADGDAKLLIEENSKGKFLDKFDVIFLLCDKTD